MRWVAILLLAGSALFPPWQLEVQQAGAKRSSPAGYHPLWNPPSTEVEMDSEEGSAGYRPDLVRLGIQLGGILAAVNIAVYLLKTKSEPTKAED